MPDKVRVDKWLWSVRIFKSRSLASKACKDGDVQVNGVKTKPAALVQVGDQLQVHKNGYNLRFEVVQLIEKRVSATLAQPCYVDHTPPEEMDKFKDWYVGKAGAEYREKGLGRPTKKERRIIDRFKTDSN